MENYKKNGIYFSKITKYLHIKFSRFYEKKKTICFEKAFKGLFFKSICKKFVTDKVWI